MSKPKRPPLTADELKLLVGKHRTWAAVARHLGLGVSTVKMRASTLGVTLDDGEQPDGVPDETGAINITSDTPAEWGDIRKLLASRGLNLDDDWKIARARVNSWGGPDGNDNQQLRVDLEPKIGIVVPARADGWRPPTPPANDTRGRAELVAVFSDQHVPRQDKRLHAGVLKWLETHQPDRAIIAGDLLDYGPVSRHRSDPGEATLQETIDQAYALLRDYRQASPTTSWSWLDGNHEDRMRNAVLDQLSSIYGIKRADAEASEHPVLSVPHLLRLDELGIEYHGSERQDYRHAQIRITPQLACRHGWIATKGSGASALKTLQTLNYSVIVGHTHRQSLVYKSGHSITGEPITLLGCEAGTLATVDATGMGYAPAPDWQNGFATVSVFEPTDNNPDGTFKVDLATYVAGRLMWRDWSIEP